MGRQEGAARLDEENGIKGMQARRFGIELATIVLGVSGMASSAPAIAQPMALLDRHGSRIAIEPYAPNIVRVTIA
ncbi:MAG: hypothetical protein CL949_01570, partial [Erythrobacter sp.]|nr:hypothetical protein [Erythrobacter sp.]